jgi:secondary thiamine-phosphate synthase enzyme
MKTANDKIVCSTTAGIDIIDITEEAHDFVGKNKLADGLLIISVPGSTASITTIEYESGVVEDLKRTVEELVPSNRHYAHDSRWGDGNGYSHVRAALFKPSLTIPIINGKLELGTWQQIVLLDFDNRKRKRGITLSLIGT